MRKYLMAFCFVVLMLPQSVIGQTTEDSQLNEAKALNEQAVQLYNAGRYAEAEPLYKRALAIWEEKLGKDHPDVATVLNNLAELYQTTGRYAEAEPLYKRALEIREEKFGEDDPLVATILNNLADLYQTTGRYVEAEPLYKRAREIDEKAYGKDHPTAPLSLRGHHAPRYPEAERREREALEREETRLRRARQEDRARQEASEGKLEKSLVAKKEPDITGEVLERREPKEALEKEVAISRFPTIESPEEVQVGEEFPIQILLTEEFISDRTRVKHIDEKFGKVNDGALKLTLPNQKEWTIDVLLSASDFTLLSRNTNSIKLFREGDSTPAIFYLKAKNIQADKKPSQIFVTLWYQGAYVARIVHDIVISRTPASLTERQKAIHPVTSEVRAIDFNSELEPPDLTVVYLEIPGNGADRDALIMINSPYLSPDHKIIKIPQGLREWIELQYKKIEEITRRSGRGTRVKLGTSSGEQSQKEEALAIMRGFGKELYNRCAPEVFKDSFWKLADRLGKNFNSIQIITNNPIIPWELMRPYRPGGLEERNYMGVEFHIGRWHSSEGGNILERPPQVVELERLVVIAPEYEGSDTLPGQIEELKKLEEIKGFTRLTPRLSELRNLFNDFPKGIIHFAGHGVVTASDKGVPNYVIRLEDSDLDVLTWEGLIGSRTKEHPFFFFNACDVGQANLIANFVDGWAPAVLDAGASGYIGALWPLSDNGAAEFAEYFYGELKNSTQSEAVNVAELLREGRSLFLKNGDPSFMAYVFYGDPHLRIKRK